MEKIRLQKADLLAAIQENREGHRAIYEQALEGYKDQVREELEDYLRKIDKDMILQVRIALPMPEEHLKDYDRIIRAIEMSIDEVIELNEYEFAQYVMDDWGWKNSFEASNTGYAAKAASKFSPPIR